MHSISQVDGPMISEIRRSAMDAADRGLIISSKWSSELLLSIPASKRNQAKGSTFNANTSSASIMLPDDLEDQPKWLTRQEVEEEERDADVLSVARKCMQARQYHRAIHFLRSCSSAKARFLTVYCQFITSEKKALLAWHKLDNTRHQPPLPVNSSLNDLLESIEKTDDPWLQFMEALFLHRLSRISEALSVLYRSISSCPWNWSAWIVLGQCLDSSATLTDALTNIDLPLDHPLPQMFQVKIMNELHTATEVELQLCDRLLGKDYFPGSLWLMGQRGRALYDTLAFDKALHQFKTMFQLDPSRIEDLDVYSNVLHIREKREELTALAEKFLLVDKNRPEVCLIVGNHYSLRLERDRAVKYFRRATQLDRTCLQAWTLMGLEYHEMANYPAAIESFRKALDINKKDSRPWAGLGAAYDAMAMPHYALFYYQQAAKLRPSEASIWEGLGNCFEIMGLAKTTDSLNCFKRALELADRMPIARRVSMHLKIAKLSRTLERFDEAVDQDFKLIRMCDRELEVDPKVRDNIMEQYLACMFNVAEHHRKTDKNLMLAKDYYVWYLSLGDFPKIKQSLDDLKMRAQARGCLLKDDDAPAFGFSLDYKAGRVFLLDYLTKNHLPVINIAYGRSSTL